MNLRIFELSVSLPLLIISLVVLTIVLFIAIRNNKRRIYIPLIVSSYGLIYSILQVFVLGAGYSGIPFVLISWLFSFLLGVSALFVIWKTYKTKIS